MTNRDYIRDDIEGSGDFMQDETKIVKRVLNRSNSKHKEFLDSEFEEYDDVVEFYQQVLY